MFDFIAGEVLLIDKPYDWTSFDVVNKIRYNIRQALSVKKIKVGHAGTLDPLATGLLIICTGKFTKRIDEFQAQEKEYTTTFKLGETTPSFDLEKQVDQAFPTAHITEEMIKAAAEKLTGTYDQIPPQFSAKKIDGKRAFDHAREGNEVEIKPHRISVTEFRIDKIDMPFVEATIVCSKGTYIRSLARDFGEALNSGAHLTELRRTRIGNFKVEDAVDVEQMKLLISTCNVNPEN